MLWNKHLNWDDTVDDQDMKMWEMIKFDLEQIHDCKLRRCLTTGKNTDKVAYKLVCFCDASTRAYAAVIYLVQTNSEGKTSSDLIYSKSRLAPVKSMTIPRLELMGVLIGVRCLNFVKSQLPFSVTTAITLTDSQCVLNWLNSEKDHPTFVKNRISEIRGYEDVIFRYVRSKENPGDIASRGVSLKKLEDNRLWWFGPEWLTKPEQDWVHDEFESNHTDQDTTGDPYPKENEETGLLQYSATEKQATKSEEESVSPFDLNCENYSSIMKLFRVTAYVLRFIQRIKLSVSKNKSVKSDSSMVYLSSDELKKAEQMWLVHVQRKHFYGVHNDIKMNKKNNLQKQLGLFLDENGLLRCRGRLGNASLTEGAKFPILLPKTDRLTYLIIDQSHKQILHSGTSQTLSQVRVKYWILQGRATVKTVLRNCITCRKHEGGPYQTPVMPSLPKTRVTEACPFSRTGLDYMGPIYVKTNEGTRKSWECLFTCLVTRAIHLELMRNMSAEEFLLGFRRFTAVRGTAIEIWSDNAAQFKTASDVLQSLWKRIVKSEEVQNYVSNSGIKWSFIVELAPWMGGFYERLVGLVKRSLRKSVGSNLLTDTQLETLIKEIEAVVNSRPLVYVGDDIDSSLVITPGHFLTLNP